MADAGGTFETVADGNSGAEENSYFFREPKSPLAHEEGGLAPA